MLGYANEKVILTDWGNDLHKVLNTINEKPEKQNVQYLEETKKQM